VAEKVAACLGGSMQPLEMFECVDCGWVGDEGEGLVQSVDQTMCKSLTHDRKE
jgi:hypothetical protein